MATITDGTNLIYIPSWTTSTNLGPLPTTAFPADCLNSLWDFNTPGLGMPWTHMTQGCAAKTCCPSGNFYTEPWAWMTSYYSPGVCPSQYRSCAGPQGASALSSAPGETIAFCCPTNYNCPNTVGPGGFFQYCQSTLATPTAVIVVDNLFDQKTLSTSSWTLSPGMGGSYQVAYPIQVRTGAKAAVTTPTTTPSTSTANSGTTTPTTGATNTAATTPATGTTNGGSGWNTGTIIGVAVSVTCSVLGLAFGVGFKIWKHRKQQKQDAAIAAGELNTISEGGKGTSNVNQMAFGAGNRYELQ